MFVAADYPFLDVVGTIIVFFAWVAWFWVLVAVCGDLFRRHDISGWGKAAWTLFVLVVPFLGVFVYLIAQGKHMAERKAQDMAGAQKQMDDYVRSVSHSNGATEQISKAKELLDKGAIDQGEYDRIKEKALA
jgi:hypothetical protein